ncbi:MAG: hypothetical protein ACRDHN_17520 [Thermomicrobiales bacterium]
MSEQDRQQVNKYAREVLSGSQVVLGQRPAASAAAAPRAAASIGPGLSAPRTMFVFCLAALTAIALIVYAISGFGTASIIFFILSLVLMSGRFVF